MSEDHYDVKVYHTHPDKRKSLRMEEKIKRGTAFAVAERLRETHINASESRDWPEWNSPEWNSTQWQRQFDLISRLSDQRKILDKVISAIADSHLADAVSSGIVTKPIAPSIRSDYKKNVTASEAMDEVEEMINPLEETLVKDPLATTKEYNDMLFPLTERDLNLISYTGGDVRLHKLAREETSVPVASLVKAGNDLIRKLSDEASRG